MAGTDVREPGAALTRNQKLVFDALAEAEGPLGAYDILQRLSGEGLRAPLQVYRALERLQTAGLVHRLESLNAFVACARPHCHAASTAAFAICERCGGVEEFADEALGERLGRWAAERRFTPVKTTVEIKGVCANCAN